MDRKTVVLGTLGKSERVGKSRTPLSLKVEIEIRKEDGKERLSICGETYFPDTRECWSAGQILDEVRRLLNGPETRLNYPRKKIARLLEIWEHWHLNDMRAGCEHQRAEWGTDAKIELVTYKPKPDVLVKAHGVEREAIRRLERGETVTYSPEEIHLATLPYRIVRGATLSEPGPEWEVEKRETKTAGWVKPDEDPAGLLAKPCPTCGYKYGTAWLYEPLPAEVVAFLEDF